MDQFIAILINGIRFDEFELDIVAVRMVARRCLRTINLIHSISSASELASEFSGQGGNVPVGKLLDEQKCVELCIHLAGHAERPAEPCSIHKILWR